MKRLFVVLLALTLLSVGAVSAESVRLGGMTGPTTMGLVGLLDKDEKGETQNDYEFTLAGSADVLTPMLVKGELDIACVPANLASVLYNNTKGGVKLLNINTLGVLYIVAREKDVVSISDLKGTTLLATGKGSTPEYALRYVLSQNGINPDTDLTIEWKSEPAEAVSLMAQDSSLIAMLPQPYVTVASGQLGDLKTALNLTAEWNKIEGAGEMITGVAVVRSDFLENNKEAVDLFLADYEESINFVNANNDEAAELIEHFGVFKAAVAKKALPYCNIAFIGGNEAKELITKYLTVLFEQNPKAVGGALPSDDFFYEAN